MHYCRYVNSGTLFYMWDGDLFQIDAPGSFVAGRYNRLMSRIHTHTHTVEFIYKLESGRLEISTRLEYFSDEYLSMLFDEYDVVAKFIAERDTLAEYAREKYGLVALPPPNFGHMRNTQNQTAKILSMTTNCVPKLPRPSNQVENILETSYTGFNLKSHDNNESYFGESTLDHELLSLAFSLVNEALNATTGKIEHIVESRLYPKYGDYPPFDFRWIYSLEYIYYYSYDNFYAIIRDFHDLSAIPDEIKHLTLDEIGEIYGITIFADSRDMVARNVNEVSHFFQSITWPFLSRMETIDKILYSEIYAGEKIFTLFWSYQTVEMLYGAYIDISYWPRFNQVARLYRDEYGGLTRIEMESIILDDSNLAIPGAVIHFHLSHD